jgi:hypothetical protein
MIYDVTQETEEEMPYIADQPFNTWAEDETGQYKTMTIDMSLTPRQEALRDGTAVAGATVGIARQQRLAQMERNLADCQDFVADCDRYAEFMKTLENPCVHEIVPRMMGRHLADLRRHAIASGRQTRDELAILRRQG